jgi:hypothetical protein
MGEEEKSEGRGTDMAEDDVLAVQPRSLDCADEELGSVDHRVRITGQRVAFKSVGVRRHVWGTHLRSVGVTTRVGLYREPPHNTGRMSTGLFA